MGRVLCLDEQRADREWKAVNKACKQAQFVYDFIASNGIIPNREDIEAIANTVNLYSLVERYRAIENEKIKSFVEQYAGTPLVEGIEEKINRKAESFRRELINCRSMINHFAQNYFDYLDFYDSGVSINSEYDVEYFRKKFSVTLTKPEHFDLYKKHVNCCKLLNELADHPANEFEALDRLFYFNPETKEFELNIEVYYPTIFDMQDSDYKDFINDNNY